MKIHLASKYSVAIQLNSTDVLRQDYLNQIIQPIKQSAIAQEISDSFRFSHFSTQGIRMIVKELPSHFPSFKCKFCIFLMNLIFLNRYGLLWVQMKITVGGVTFSQSLP